MANRFIAWNVAHSLTTAVQAGASYATGAKVAIQLATPSTLELTIVEWGVSFDGSSAATPAIVELVIAGAASTCSSAHSTTTIQNYGPSALASKLSMGTTTTGYGNGSITTNTTAQTWDKQYVAPTNQYLKLWPLGREPVLGASKFLQLRISTSATVNALAYIVWEEA
jgi:hypothetical protein